MWPTSAIASAAVENALARYPLAIDSAAVENASARHPNDGALRGALMKAVVYDRYGSPEVLAVQDIERPAPGEGEVLVKVVAVSLNLSDWEALTGSPFYVRVHGLLRPRHRILGSDIAGTVEAVGSGVKEFRVGDDVFGDALGTFGGFAEYACVPSKVLMKKPAALSHEQVATVPQAGIIAVQGLREGGALQPGQKVLINGAGGGSGMFAIQLAKLRGAEVTAVDSAEKLDHMRALGADHVLDYRQVDFAQTGQRYDLILDLVGTRSALEVRRALTRGGTYTMVGGTMESLAQVLLLGPVVGRLVGVRIKMLAAKANADDFAILLGYIESGAIRLTIDRRFRLEDAAEAIRYVGQGRSKGKVLVTP